MNDNDKELKKTFRKGWLLVFAGLIYIAAYLLLATATNIPDSPRTWDMDGKAFVPASSPYANGYPMKVPAPAKGGNQ